MTDMTPQERLNRVMNGMKRSAAHEIKHQVRNAVPRMAEFFDEPHDEYEAEGQERNFSQEDDWDLEAEDGGEEFEEGEEGEDEGEGPDYSLSFENVNEAESNLSLAVAAWRICSEFTDDVVAQYKSTGITFFGRPADFQEFCAQRDLKPGDWNVQTDEKTLRSMDSDLATMRQILDDLDSDGDWLEDAEKQFEAFHWGDKPASTGIIDIPGLSPDAKPYLLGVAREICYGAKKEGGFVEYYHLHGEETKQYPMVYGLGKNCYLVYGANMEVSPRGILE